MSKTPSELSAVTVHSYLVRRLLPPLESFLLLEPPLLSGGETFVTFIPRYLLLTPSSRNVGKICGFCVDAFSICDGCTSSLSTTPPPAWSCGSGSISSSASAGCESLVSSAFGGAAGVESTALSCDTFSTAAWDGAALTASGSFDAEDVDSFNGDSLPDEISMAATPSVDSVAGMEDPSREPGNTVVVGAFFSGREVMDVRFRFSLR